MWKTFAEFVVNRRAWVLAALVLLSLFFAVQYKNLRFENRLTQWIPEEDETLKLLKTTGDMFGANELVLVMVKPRQAEAFSPSFLGTVKNLAQSLREQKHIFMVTAIDNVPFIEKTNEGLEIKNFLENSPRSPAEAEELKGYALKKENYVNNVVSGDGKWLTLAVYLKGADDPIWAFDHEVRRPVEEQLARRAEIHYSGIPADAFYANRFVSSDLVKLVPLIVILVVLILFYTFRNVAGVAYPLLTVGIASFWVFGFMGLAGQKMTLITPALPVLLIALGSEYGIHLVDRMLREASAAEPLQGIKEAVRQVAVPILLAALTTIGGFLSFFTAKLTVIKDFGLLSAWGILFALIIVLTFIPAAQAVVKKNGHGYKTRQSLGFTRLANLLAKVTLQRRGLILILSLAVFVLFIIWIPRIQREVNFTGYFAKNSPPRQGALIAQKEFGGAYPLTLYIKSGGSLKEEEFRERLREFAASPGEEGVLGAWKRLVRIAAWRPSFPEIKSAGLLRLVRRAENSLLNVDNTGTPFSVADLIQEMNYQLNGTYSLPATDRGVGNLWFFIEGRGELRQLVTEDASQALVISKANQAATSLMKKIHFQVQDYLRQEFSQPWREYTLSSLSPGDRLKVSQEEARLIAEEIFWLARRYGNGKRLGKELDQAEIRTRLVQAVAQMPRPYDSDVRRLTEQSFGEYVGSEGFNFFLQPEVREALLRDLTAGALENDPGAARRKWLAAVRRVVPQEEFDEQIASDVADTLAVRLEESRVLAFSRRAWAQLEELLPEKAIGNENARRKILGLLAEAADGLAVVPATGLEGIAGRDPGLGSIEQSGMPAALSRLDYYLLSSQIQSICLVLIITFLLMSAMRKSFRLGIISTIPIIIVVAAVYGTLGLAKIPLDYATMMIAGVSFGVGIDYSIHFVYGVGQALKNTASLEKAVETAFREKGRAILANSIAVTMGFLVLLMSSMSPLRTFGGMMVLSMLLAALTSLTTLPALLLWIKPFKGAK